MFASFAGCSLALHLGTTWAPTWARSEAWARSADPIPLPASRSAVAPENPAVARGGSRFFLDTADVAEWEALLPLGMFHGVTTNPMLLERAGLACTVEACSQLAAAAAALGAGEIMFQSWGASTEAMVATGLRLASIEPARVTVKVPVTAAGTAAAATLVRHGVRVCLTACYGREQALVAASVGAEYLAPYLGRMDDAGKDGLAECRAMQATVDGLGSSTRIFVASIRTPEQLSSLAAAGLDSFTFSPAVARALFDAPLTAAAAAAFEDAAERGGAYSSLGGP